MEWFMKPVEEILNEWWPADECYDRCLCGDDHCEEHHCDGKWCVLEDKRADTWYDDVCESLEKLGWVRPLSFWVHDVTGETHLGDGHHRLAAAIDLGIEAIPVYPSVRGRAVAANSGGDWSYGDPICSVTRRGDDIPVIEPAA